MKLVDKNRTVLTLEVPCVFAKSKGGIPGKHQVTVVLDTLTEKVDKNRTSNRPVVRAVTCTCLTKHGEAVQAMEEMGSLTCYRAVADVQRLLRTPGHPADSMLSVIRDTNLRNIVISAARSRNFYSKQSWKPPLEPEGITSKAQRIVNVLNMISQRKLGDKYKFTLMSNQHVYFHEEYVCVGTTNSTNNFVVDYNYVRALALKWNKDWCPFCKAHFERITKHAKGASHISEVTNFFKLCERAVSPAGLKLLTNPKYNSVFLK